MLDDPRINFAISTRGGKPGVDHLGIQTDTPDELSALQARARAADMTVLDEGETTCCYARSEKHWVTDPQGIAWEHFHTLDNIPTFGVSSRETTGEAKRLLRDRRPGTRPGRPASPPPAAEPLATPASMSVFERYLTSGCRSASSPASLSGRHSRRLPGGRPHGGRAGQHPGRHADLGDDHPDAAAGSTSARCTRCGSHWRGIGVTLFVNWAVKPFSMALLGWIFIRHVFAPWLPADQLDSYIAGLILLAAAPCTAMVFVWSRLTQRRPATSRCRRWR